MAALESISTLALLGVRFRDAVNGTQIRDGLRVWGARTVSPTTALP